MCVFIKWRTSPARDRESGIQGLLKQRILAGRNTIKYDSNMLRGREMPGGQKRYTKIYGLI